VILDEIYRFPEFFEILRGDRLGTTARAQNRPFFTSRFGLNGTLTAIREVACQAGFLAPIWNVISP